jgi:hypothetical protein
MQRGKGAADAGSEDGHVSGGIVVQGRIAGGKAVPDRPEGDGERRFIGCARAGLLAVDTNNRRLVTHRPAPRGKLRGRCDRGSIAVEPRGRPIY